MQENKIYMIQTDMCFVLLQVPEDLKRQADKRIKALTTGKVQSVVMCAHMYCFSQHALWSCPFPLPFSSRIHLITHLSHTSPLTHTTPPTLPLTHFTPHTGHNWYVGWKVILQASVSHRVWVTDEGNLPAVHLISTRQNSIRWEHDRQGKKTETETGKICGIGAFKTTNWPGY